MRLASLLLLAAPLLFTSCGGSSDPGELTDEGNQALGTGDFSAAQASFEKALEIIGDDTAHPRYLEASLGAIEAKAKADPDGALADIQALAAALPGKVTDRDYSRIASTMGSNDHLTQAIELVKFARGSFPESESLGKQIKALGDKAKAEASATGNEANLKAIQGLGYGGG